VIQGLFADFDPKFKQLIDALDESVHKWRMRTVPVLPTWVRGHAALLGDAAHAMLPTLGQGAAMGFEEAGTLGVLFPLGTTREQVPARLAAYEALRKPRADYIATESTEQIMNPAKRGAMMKCEYFRIYIFGGVF
jgi:salicylate hydroxylase